MLFRMETTMEQDPNWNELSPAEKARTLAEYARQASREGDDQSAYGYYAQSLNLYRGLDDRPNILRNLIRISYLSGWADFGDGLDMFARRQTLGEEAVPLAREIGDSALLASALCAFSVGFPSEQAMVMLVESIALAEASGEKGTLAWALYRLGNTTSLSGERNSARMLYERALGLYEEIEDKAGMATVLDSMATRADRATKRSYLERALELQRELGAKKRMAEILIKLDMFCDPQDLGRREAYNLEALALCRKFGSPIWEAGCLNRLAEIARLRGDTSRAEALEAESRSIYEEPEIDPALMEAFEKALESGDVQKITGAWKEVSNS
jgi:tetratricopeptide (TPR) repeat protein